MSAVFHLLTILEKVVEPEAMRICRMRFLHAVSLTSFSSDATDWKFSMPLSDTRRKAWAVRSLVCSLTRFQTPSRRVKPSVARILGRMRISKCDIE